uniref:(northern house mosquito) hypothetical protein n=1 Tax=Culex pipiens TaxID=7175 RepID=A0A8D8I9Z6_CULPI
MSVLNRLVIVRLIKCFGILFGILYDQLNMLRLVGFGTLGYGDTAGIIAHPFIGCTPRTVFRTGAGHEEERSAQMAYPGPFFSSSSNGSRQPPPEPSFIGFSELEL